MTSPAGADFRLRDIWLAAYGPSIVSAIGHGAVMPILALRALELGAAREQALGPPAVALGDVPDRAPARPALDPAVIDPEHGWRLAFLIGAGLAIAMAQAGGVPEQMLAAMQPLLKAALNRLPIA